MIRPDFAEQLQQANDAPLVDRADRCCIACGLIGGLLTVIAITIGQNWQAIASLFN